MKDRSDRLQKLLNKSTLKESVGHRSDDVVIPSTIDISVFAAPGDNAAYTICW